MSSSSTTSSPSLKSALRRPAQQQQGDAASLPQHAGVVGTSAFDERQQQYRHGSTDSTLSSTSSSPSSSSPSGAVTTGAGANSTPTVSSPTPSQQSSLAASTSTSALPTSTGESGVVKDDQEHQQEQQVQPPTRNFSTLSSSSALSTSSSVASGGAGSSTAVKDGYLRRVAFDTMPDAASTTSHDFSFTLQVKSKGYRRTRNTRTFMCAVDGNSHSTHALEWLLDHLVEDGDEVVALRVLDAARVSGAESDSSDSSGDEAEDEKKLEEYREEANELLKSIEDLNDETGDRRISIVVEFVSADPRRRTLTTSITSTVVRLIHMYRPDSITIGTRGKTATLMQKMMMGAGFSNSVVVGSVSREILSRSPVPVIVVRPETKVEKHLKKRQANPARRSYHDLMANALHGHSHGNKASTHVLGRPAKTATSGTTASPLSASFGPEVSSDKASVSSSTSTTSSSSSSSSHPAEEASESGPKSSSKSKSKTNDDEDDKEKDTTTTGGSVATEIAKKKPSLRVLEREQHPAGAESLSISPTSKDKEKK
ncbi:hypothetical protein OC842_001695 [Tilletia horrida]|uniref:UspA domain-containing protein n=1 Tax=Tilletia horrida TaxID=155126 RepID=A0AAN6GF36_9BASI|nr:hypothetical protein OC842_001695 [Tilletia horrida]